jgi:hypothetical protein
MSEIPCKLFACESFSSLRSCRGNPRRRNHKLKKSIMTAIPLANILHFSACGANILSVPERESRQ